MTVRTRIGRALVWLQHRLTGRRGTLVPVVKQLAGDADARRWADGRRRFWAELREGQREASAASGVDSTRVTP